MVIGTGIILALFFCLPGIYSLVTGPPFKPTTERKISVALSLGQIGPGRIVYDLGCGDGRLLRAAAAHGACAIGYELSLPTYLLAKIRCAFHPRTRVRFGNFWKQAYDDADVIFCFLVPSVMQRFHDEIWLRLQPGCRVLSNAFPIPGLQHVTTENGVYLYEKTRISLHISPQSSASRTARHAPLPQKRALPAVPGL